MAETTRVNLALFKNKKRGILDGVEIFHNKYELFTRSEIQNVCSIEVNSRRRYELRSSLGYKSQQILEEQVIKAFAVICPTLTPDQLAMIKREVPALQVETASTSNSAT